MLRFKLKDKLPKAKHPEEYKKHITVLDATQENWTFRCSFCTLKFKGRAHRANCHLIGKIGEGVTICNKISQSERLKFAERVFSRVVCQRSLQNGRANCEEGKQSTLSNFVSKANFELTDAEIAKFVLTSGVSFEAIRNPHFQAGFSSLNARYEVQSDYKLKAFVRQ